MALLKNKVAIVTGASSGIGAVIAEKFAEEGAKVVMVGRNKDRLANVAKQVEAKGNKPLVVVGDVTNEDDCRRIVSETLKHFGKLDVLVNNAGIVGNAMSILDEDIVNKLDKVLSTNLRSVVFMTHVAALHLIESKGNIINISSIASKKTLIAIPFGYSVSKAALDHFSRCNALEFSSKGVRVNVINPGPVRTEVMENSGLTDPAAVEQHWENMRAATALKRNGECEEIADLAAFLASDKARSITGGTYVSDNGMLINGGGESRDKYRK
ncbi:enoyl-(Acyl carrier protein) reductase domain-containing protein [Phthorimaea operculella]|nr:enoyl-(Acyl carrier protein) reductase domain-containing protein [Phthorimaea operculella]